ncbi:hypothetical protein NCER_100056 [Vairimorpha ceranae BRL01]|uniref:Uncharacterized protein n=2 Tax=Vairimorpha ceranae TaxID=40302 RepID=C4V6M1_VAIC1|nr:hypothetical protein AAJ76_1600033726 [Vairimorpha ceranae]EEQ83126.1 hypothetical protein NCER_100056 [Vairimorpha ceranae BRL01]KAF5141124.1 hypothetical protein G9O61_00g004400 [Vairimorpha ceranae]KKO75613.1 hypothetical protein AAJ76_1600033726 [Vairimorpha ceranae]
MNYKNIIFYLLILVNAIFCSEDINEEGIQRIVKRGMIKRIREINERFIYLINYNIYLILKIINNEKVSSVQIEKEVLNNSAQKGESSGTSEQVSSLQTKINQSLQTDPTTTKNEKSWYFKFFIYTLILTLALALLYLLILLYYLITEGIQIFRHL